jgi:UDP-N-acetylglucosamine 2-epimerase (non-hydrolysing)
MLKVLHVVGSRPNFMKTAPIMAEMARYPDSFRQVLVHTGQHYDYNMSKIFFEDLDMPSPDDFLNVGSGSHADQTARIMIAFEPIIEKHQPDIVLVVGDVNSTLASALVCAKLNVRLGHIEAGLRSFDRTMPEEINRLVTDQLSDILFTPSIDANENLAREGISAEKVHFVGNVMIDSLVRLLPRTDDDQPLRARGMSSRGYVLATLHRPANVDCLENLRQILDALVIIGADIPVICPMHPRTQKRLEESNLQVHPRVQVMEPLGYIDFLTLQRNARLIITDSGGVQEETTYLDVPCLTVRPNTERPITIRMGTNKLVAASTEPLVEAARQFLLNPPTRNAIPDLWDGHTAQRVVNLLKA